MNRISLISWARRLHRDESGVALAAVAILAMVIMMMVPVMMNRAGGESSSTESDRSYEQTFHIAEAGADQGVADIVQGIASGSPTVPDVAYDADFAGLEEKEWAVYQAEAFAPESTPEGEFVMFTVSSEEILYSVGYTPGKDAPDRVERVVKTEYSTLSAEFPLEFAVLGDGDVEFDDDNDEGLIVVTGANGSVHANGAMEADDDEPPNPQVSGDASATGNITDVDVAGTTTPGAPPEAVPNIIPRAYFQFAEYVLCPDGSVHRGPASGGVSAVPCGDVADRLSFAPYLGWEHGGEWEHDSFGLGEGVYYAYQEDIRLRGGKTWPLSVTLIAESDDGSCNGTGGNIRIRPETGTLIFNARADDLVIMAQGEFRIDDGDDAVMELNGIVATNGRARLEVDEGTLDINGALVASADCDGGGEAIEMEADDGGVFTVDYDGGMMLLESALPVGIDLSRRTEL